MNVGHGIMGLTLAAHLLMILNTIAASALGWLTYYEPFAVGPPSA